MTASRRRPNAIGADDARSWARKINLGNPYAKAILMALANYMNEDGTAYPGIDTISGDTDINPNTVVNRQRWLANIGCITLSKCWVDENGRRNKDGRGRVTSSEIRFLFDADIDAIEAAALSDGAKPLQGAAKNSHQNRAVSPPPHGVLNSTQEQGVSPQLAPNLPPTGRDAHIYESSKEEDSLPTLPSGGLEKISDQPAKGSEERWQKFKIGYPDGMLDPGRAHAEFFRLSEGDQLACNSALPGYADWLRKRKQKSFKAHLFIRKRSWEGLAASAQIQAICPSAYDPHAPEGRAILALGRIARYTPVRLGDGRISFRGEVTPQLLAMAEPFPDAPSATYRRGTPNFGSWNDLIRKVFAGCNLPALTEIIAPYPYAPSVTGKVYSGSDPPPFVDGTLATDEDLEEMAKG